MMKRGLKTLKLLQAVSRLTAAYLQRGAIYYGKGRMTQGRAKRLGN